MAVRGGFTPRWNICRMSDVYRAGGFQVVDGYVSFRPISVGTCARERASRAMLSPIPSENKIQYGLTQSAVRAALKLI